MAKKGSKGKQTTNPSSLKVEHAKLAQKWLEYGNHPTKRREDYSSTEVLGWWKKNEPLHAEIADWVRRRSCAQESSATSKRAFSKVGLIMSKKRQRMMADRVDNIGLMGWLYKDNV